MESIINNETPLNGLLERYQNKYQTANPYPSIHFDDFFDENFLSKVLSEFPDLSKHKVLKYDNANERKLAGKGEMLFGPYTMRLMHFLNSEPFLQFLQELTGIKELLIPDPYFVGGGHHEIKPGGYLKVHADFNKHPSLGLDRRINVLIYLNKDWDEAFGGHFELWDSEMKGCVSKILPVFNRLAIFSTTDFSFHGHPDPLQCPGGRSRKSLALYYYSLGRPETEVARQHDADHTLFRKRPGVKSDRSFSLKEMMRQITPPLMFNSLKRIASYFES